MDAALRNRTEAEKARLNFGIARCSPQDSSHREQTVGMATAPAPSTSSSTLVNDDPALSDGAKPTQNEQALHVLHQFTLNPYLSAFEVPEGAVIHRDINAMLERREQLDLARKQRSSSASSSSEPTRQKPTQGSPKAQQQQDMALDQDCTQHSAISTQPSETPKCTPTALGLWTRSTLPSHLPAPPVSITRGPPPPPRNPRIDLRDQDRLHSLLSHTKKSDPPSTSNHLIRSSPPHPPHPTAPAPAPERSELADEDWRKRSGAEEPGTYQAQALSCFDRILSPDFSLTAPGSRHLTRQSRPLAPRTSNVVPESKPTRSQAPLAHLRGRVSLHHSPPPNSHHSPPTPPPSSDPGASQSLAPLPAVPSSPGLAATPRVGPPPAGLRAGLPGRAGWRAQSFFTADPDLSSSEASPSATPARPERRPGRATPRAAKKVAFVSPPPERPGGQAESETLDPCGRLDLPQVSSASTPRVAGHYPATPAVKAPERGSAHSIPSLEADQRRLAHRLSAPRLGSKRLPHLEAEDVGGGLPEGSAAQVQPADRVGQAPAQPSNPQVARGTKEPLLSPPRKHAYSSKGKEREVQDPAAPSSGPPTSTHHPPSSSHAPGNYLNALRISGSPAFDQGWDETGINPERTTLTIGATPHPPGHLSSTPDCRAQKTDTLPLAHRGLKLKKALPRPRQGGHSARRTRTAESALAPDVNRNLLPRTMKSDLSPPPAIPAQSSNLLSRGAERTHSPESPPSACPHPRSQLFNPTRPASTQNPLKEPPLPNDGPSEAQTRGAHARESASAESQGRPPRDTQIPATPAADPAAKNGNPTWASPSFSGFDGAEQQLTSTPPGNTALLPSHRTESIPAHQVKWKDSRPVPTDANQHWEQGDFFQNMVKDLNSVVDDIKSQKPGLEGLAETNSFMSLSNEGLPDTDKSQYLLELKALSEASDKIERTRCRLRAKLGGSELGEETKDASILKEILKNRKGEEADFKHRMNLRGGMGWPNLGGKRVGSIVMVIALQMMLTWLILHLATMRAASLVQSHQLVANPVLISLRMSPTSMSPTKALLKALVHWFRGLHRLDLYDLHGRFVPFEAENDCSQSSSCMFWWSLKKLVYLKVLRLGNLEDAYQEGSGLYNPKINSGHHAGLSDHHIFFPS